MRSTTSAVPGNPDRPTLPSMMEHAVSMMQAGKAEAALDVCMEALGRAPTNAAFNELAALAAIRLARFAEAEVFARRSLRARPDHVGGFVALGRALRGLERYAEAGDSLQRAQALAPGHPGAAFLLCTVWLQARDPRAAALVETLLARFPREAGWEEIGHALLGLGRSEAALACFSRALRATPGFALAMRVGMLHRDLGQPGEAATAFRIATDAEPAAVRAWFLLGLSLQDKGRPDEAAKAYRGALECDPHLAEAAVNLGTALQEAGDMDGAKAAYGRAVGTRADTFGRIAQAMTNAPRGELWLDLGRLRRVLGA